MHFSISWWSRVSPLAVVTSEGWFSFYQSDLSNLKILNNDCSKKWKQGRNSQESEKLRQFETINSPMLLKKHLIKQSVIWKQEETPFIICVLAKNFKSVGVSDIYLFFELRGNFWNGTHDLPSYKCFLFLSKVIHNCQTWRNKSHNKQNWYVSVICNGNCFAIGTAHRKGPRALDFFCSWD